jgi:Ca2+-binding RTX toxin-like protein
MANVIGTNDNDSLNGTPGDDLIGGLAGNDALSGDAGNDTLTGGAGADQLYGGDGNDVYNGGAGNDVMEDWGGSDTYVWGLGSGQDVVRDWGWDPGDVDTVLVTSGVTPGNLFIIQDWTSYGSLTLRLAQSDDQVLIQNGNSIEQIQFADGTVWDTATLQARVQQVQTGTAGNDYLSGYATNNYLDGGAGDDVLSGSSGNDALIGGAGNDQLYGGYGNDVYNGGAGDDVMQDWGGSDTYIFGIGSGQDTVQDWSSDVNDVDTVLVTGGVVPGSLFITQDWANNGAIILRLAQSNDQLVIQNVNGTNAIEQIQFADGTLWDSAAIQFQLQQSQIGTEGSEYLWGNAESNYLQGLGGNDQLYGQAGDDVLLGGAGDDVLDGGRGNDVLDGGAGTDFMFDYQGGSDTYRWGVGSGQDSVSDFGWEPGEIDHVEVVGALPGEVRVTRDLGVNAHAITLQLATGESLTLYNWFDPAGQIEEIRFADGTVWDAAAVLARLENTLMGTEGADWLSGSELADTIHGLGGNDQLYGQAGDDVLLGGAGDDVLDGGRGNDVLDGGAGTDTMFGGKGDDLYIVDNTSDIVSEISNEGIDTVQSSVSYTISTAIENLRLTGIAATNAIGNELDNVLIGNGAANLLDGRAGADTMIGGQGDDVYVVENVGDVVVENRNEGTDTVQSSITHTLGANVDNLTLTGTASINGTGNGQDNVLIGNSGANILTGGAGNDTYVIGAGDTVVEVAGEGIDTVQSALTYTLGSNVENLTLTGSAAINGTGNSLDNVLVGNSAANTLTGGAGDDTYVVGPGDTVVELNNGGIDTVQSSVTWTLGSNLENLTLIGTAAVNGTGNGSANVMIGNSANNVLSAAGGNDTLRGGWGNDTLNGGNGNDTYLFGRGDGQDLVQDNNGSADKIVYDAGIDPLDLVISRQANDLRIAVYGSTDYITVQNWYTNSSNRIETIEAGNAQTLLSSQVEQLIQSMASFTQQTGVTWEQAIDQRPQEVQAVLAASWQ